MTNISLEPEGAWIEWKGGECPVPDECRVDIRQRNGKQRGPSEAGFWKALNGRPDLWQRERAWRPIDIIAFRTVKP